MHSQCKGFYFGQLLVVALNKDQQADLGTEGAVLTSGRFGYHSREPFLVSPITQAESHPLPIAAREVNRLATEQSALWRSVAWVGVLK